MENFKPYFTVKNIIFLILILAVIKFIAEVKDLALLFFASFVIACALNPLVEKLSKYMKRSLATGITVSGFFIAFLSTFLPLIVALIDTLSKLFKDLPHRIAIIENFLETKEIYNMPLNEIINFKQLEHYSNNIFGDVFEKTLEASCGIIGAVTILFIIAMIVFYILDDKEDMKKWFYSLFPPNIRTRAKEVSENITIKVGGFVIAQGVSMLSVWLLTAIFLGILGVPHAILLGLIAGILDIVPIVGPIVSALFGIGMSAHLGLGIVICVIFSYILAQWLSNNLVRPHIFGKFMNLHPLVVLVSFLVAAKFINVWGVILAPAMAAVIVVLFDEVYIKQINKKTDTSKD